MESLPRGWRRSIPLLPRTLAAFALVLAAGLVALSQAGLLHLDDTARSRPLTHAERVQALVDRHACWSGPAPLDMEGRMPGHVVVTTAQGRLLYSRRLVRPALDVVFGDSDRALTVHAFCR